MIKLLFSSLSIFKYTQKFRVSFVLIVFSASFVFLVFAQAQAQNTVDVNINTLTPAHRATISVSPRTATFTEGSTFELPIFLNTEGQSINAVELRIKFDQSKLNIIRPSGDKSIIGVWLEPPTYNNTNGTAKLTGVIPNGITTNSGLVATITFKAVATGEATVSFSSDSHVLLNDGLGTEAATQLDRGTFTILPRPPGGVIVFSETHPFQDHWYNNNSPSIAWQKDPGVTAFNFLLDNKPFTIPDNNPITEETVKSYENLDNGLWYFHIKALKNGVWGATTHFLVRVDTLPPAEFKPKVEHLDPQVLISFFTTDNLSGIDHYEVAVVEKEKSPTDSPVFLQAESPYLLPVTISKKSKVIIRVFDRAGNVRESVVTARVLPSFLKSIGDNLAVFLGGLLVIILGTFAIHYLYGHKILAHIRRAMELLKREEKLEKLKGKEEVQKKKEKIQKIVPKSR